MDMVGMFTAPVVVDVYANAAIDAPDTPGHPSKALPLSAAEGLARSCLSGYLTKQGLYGVILLSDDCSQKECNKAFQHHGVAWGVLI